MRRSLLSLLLLCCALGPAAGRAQESHFEWRAVADAAFQRKDYAAARIGYLSALELRPDSPRYLRGLASSAALANDRAVAITALRRLAALGVGTAIEKDPAFASLQGEPDFLRLLQVLAENRTPQGQAEVLAELPAHSGIIEGLALRERTGDLFLGDAHLRAIWRRDHTGKILRFTAEDEELFGIFGLVLDEERDTLWAATTALPAMGNYAPAQKGQAALADFELSTGKLRRIVPVPADGRDHALGDLTVDANGTVYATDSLAPVIWQFSPTEAEMEKTIEAPEFHSLQGIVLFRRTLFVADYANGLFAVDLARRSVTPLEAPADTTLLGLDGLVAVPGGLAAVQNGIEPQRVVRIALSPDLGTVTGLTVLAAGLPNLTDLALITLVGDRLTFIAGAGWDGFDPPKTPHPRTHTVWILQTALP